MINGSCLCGKIEFMAQEVPKMTFNCHCSRCRKSHGSSYSTQIVAIKSSLKFSRGRDLLTEYESKGAMRTFCSLCGSRLMNFGKKGVDYLSISISAVNDRVDLVPVGECFVTEKLNFVQLDKSIAHYKKLPKF